MGCGCAFNLKNESPELWLRSGNDRNQGVRDPFVMDLTPVVMPLICLKLSLNRVIRCQPSQTPRAV